MSERITQALSEEVGLYARVIASNARQIGPLAGGPAPQPTPCARFG